MKNSFKEELSCLINRHSLENETNTPDFILAEYLIDCLKSYNKITRTRNLWYGKVKNNDDDNCLKKVICVNDNFQTQIYINRHYSVDIIAKCRCGLTAYGLKGIDNYASFKDPELKTMCRCGRTYDFNKPVFASDRFIDSPSNNRYKTSI